MSDDALTASRRQFGQNAANYATSTVHAKGASLERIVAMVGPQPQWHGLDIATAAGHTAFAFADRVASMVASDATPEMLDVAAKLAAERGIGNVTFAQADAHQLEFDDHSFDLVTCRIAPHHFAEPARFVAEASRVLRPGGTFAVVDNLAPPDVDAAIWCDDFERRRDYSHRRCLAAAEWKQLIGEAGFKLIAYDELGKKMMFGPWADNMDVAPATRAQLLADLRSAPANVIAWLRPQFGEDPSFVLTEGLLVARKPPT